MDEKVRRLRDQLPAVHSSLFLNTGTAGPIPTPVQNAIFESFQQQSQLGRITMDHYERLGALKAETRTATAALLGCDPTEVALTMNTTDGMNLATLGVNWAPGDEAITTNLEHPAALFPLYVVRDRFQVNLKIAEVLDRPHEAASIIEGLITSRTRLISLSHVSYLTGAVLPIAEICAVAHRHGVLVLVDGAQSFGAIPVDARQLGCDFYAVPGQKWLCGPEGTGALYATQAAMTQVRLSFTGYGSAAHYSLYGGLLPKESVERFEWGAVQPALVAGQLAATKWFTHEVGPAWAYDRIRALADQAWSGLAATPGVTLLTPRGSAGLVTFQIAGVSAEAASAELLRQEIRVRPVAHPFAVRIATGFYNTEDEVARTVAAVGSIASAANG